jgi:hypothetical protein
MGSSHSLSRDPVPLSPIDVKRQQQTKNMGELEAVFETHLSHECVTVDFKINGRKPVNNSNPTEMNDNVYAKQIIYMVCPSIYI